MEQRFVTKHHHYQQSCTCQLAYIAQITDADQPYFRCAHVHQKVTEVALILSGTGTYFIDHQTYTVQAGDIVIINQHVVHEEGRLLPSLHVGLQSVLVPSLPPGYLISPVLSPVIRTSYFSSLTNLAILAYNLLHHPDDLQTIWAEQLMTTLLVPALVQILTIDPDASVPKKHTESLASLRIKTFIDTHYKTIPSLRHVAEHLQMSRSYMDHQFAANYFRSPQNYLNSRRIGEAQQALINTPDRLVTEIAYEVGFRSLSRFNHAFKSTVGTTPLKFKQAYQPST